MLSGADRTMHFDTHIFWVFVDTLCIWNHRKFEDALHLYRKALDQIPLSGFSWAKSGMLKVRLGQNVLAEKDLFVAVKLDSGNNSIRYNLARISFYLIRYILSISTWVVVPVLRIYVVAQKELFSSGVILNEKWHLENRKCLWFIFNWEKIKDWKFFLSLELKTFFVTIYEFKKRRYGVLSIVCQDIPFLWIKLS